MQHVEQKIQELKKLYTKEDQLFRQLAGNASIHRLNGGSQTVTESDVSISMSLNATQSAIRRYEHKLRAIGMNPRRTSPVSRW